MVDQFQYHPTHIYTDGNDLQRLKPTNNLTAEVAENEKKIILLLRTIQCFI